MCEKLLGMTERLRPVNIQGLTFLTKHRFEDFHVHEVDESRRILHLEELIKPETVKASLEAQHRAETGQGN